MFDWRLCGEVEEIIAFEVEILVEGKKPALNLVICGWLPRGLAGAFFRISDSLFYDCSNLWSSP